MLKFYSKSSKVLFNKKFMVFKHTGWHKKPQQHTYELNLHSDNTQLVAKLNIEGLIKFNLIKYISNLIAP